MESKGNFFTGKQLKYKKYLKGMIYVYCYIKKTLCICYKHYYTNFDVVILEIDARFPSGYEYINTLLEECKI